MDSPRPGGSADRKPNDAAVLTPSPGAPASGATSAGSGADLSMGPTLRSNQAHLSPAFSGAMGTGGLPHSFTPSIPPQNLLDDKLILSAQRTDKNGVLLPVLGGIQLLAKLGQGGMGAVYYGVHPRLNQEVAVKVLPFHLAEQQPGLVQRFIREAQIAAKVRSEHLVGVIDVNEENGLFYLVMEFVHGRSAGEYLRTSAAAGCFGVEEKVALAICIGAAEGLAAAHANGVIHRDIKPDNIMIPRIKPHKSGMQAARGSGSAKAPAAAVGDVRGAAGDELDYYESKLADLGLARNETGDVSMTGVNACMGTPGYMSPEQAHDARHASKPADVFSLGATLYALLSGNAPFKGSSLMQVLNATVNEPHPPIQRIRPEITAPTAALLDRCLAKKPEDRFPDASALLQALRLSLSSVDQPMLTQIDTARAVTMLVTSPEIGLHAQASGSASPATGSRGKATGAPWVPPASSTLPNTMIVTPAPAPVASKKSGWVAVAVVFILLVLGGLGVGGYFLWEKVHNEGKERERLAADLRKREEERQARQAARLEAERLKAEDELRAQALEEEIAMAAAWRNAQDKSLSEAARAEELARQREAERVAAQKKEALDKAERERKVLEDRQRLAELAAHEAERIRENQLKRKEMAQEALSTALNVALEYKRNQQWDGVILALEDPLKTIGNQPHPNRAAVEALLKEAKEQKERQSSFKTEMDKANELLKKQDFEAAKTAFEAARKFAQEPAETAAVNDGLKRAGDGTKKGRFSQARILEVQGRGLRPDKNPKGDWAKAAEAFKSAGAMYKDLDEKDDFARTLVEQGDCFRKDNNKASGDWTQAGALYAAAATSYAAQGNKKAQADALFRHAQTMDTSLNAAGDNRQAAALYGRAALLQGDIGNKKVQADNLSFQGACLFREKPLAANAERAAEVFKRATLLYEEANDKRGQGLATLNHAICIIRGQKKDMTPEAKIMFQRAAQLSRDAGDEANAKVAENWLK